jgi:hypothetical protein
LRFFAFFAWQIDKRVRICYNEQTAKSVIIAYPTRN